MELQTQLQTAIQIAHQTGEILLSYVDTDRLDIRSKGPRDLVTAADLEAERFALDAIRSSFPVDGLVAEEGGHVESRSGRHWYLDPLDGTMNFARGIPIWCVSLALFEGSFPLIGVVHDPSQGETFAAASGLGAYLNDVPIRCTGPELLSDAFVHLTVDFNDDSMLEGLDDIRTVAPRVLRTRNLGSAALALAYVACGRFDAMLHRSAHVWDYAAGVAIIQEAGGMVTDMTGAQFSRSTISMVAAANSTVHSGLLDLMRTREHARLQ